ncbi:unnamed protein product [Cuscuta epithymum]|uniref:Uncharacterized protein n=1 Tax=Cuscuta epithymum TaxID=186058 RepID=A0AAV0DYW7_9ASTE|nr:unnamed protein product [Cuscuta epithymum]
MEGGNWKLTKNDPCTRSCSYSSSSSKPSSMMRSSSQKKSSLRRSSSQRISSSSSSSSSSNKSCSNFTRKCSNLAKEQKAKFYIVKRCIGMLLHWNKHRDSDS